MMKHGVLNEPIDVGQLWLLGRADQQLTSIFSTM